MTEKQKRKTLPELISELETEMECTCAAGKDNDPATGHTSECAINKRAMELLLGGTRAPR